MSTATVRGGFIRGKFDAARPAVEAKGRNRKAILGGTIKELEGKGRVSLHISAGSTPNRGEDLKGKEGRPRKKRALPNGAPFALTTPKRGGLLEEKLTSSGLGKG